MKTCPKCGKELKDEAKFCGGCGYKFEQAAGFACPNCGKIFKPGAKFCGGCGKPVAYANASANVDAKNQLQVNMASSFIKWNILPGQLAVKIDENDVASYKDVKGITIQDGVKALFFANGKLTAELESGSYSFKDLGISPEQPNIFRRIVSGLVNFFKGSNKQRAEENGLAANSKNFPFVSIVLIRESNFPIVYNFENITTANIRSSVAFHFIARISNINEFYKNQLLDKKFVCFENFAAELEPVVKDLLNQKLKDTSPENIENNAELRNSINESLSSIIKEVYPYCDVVRIISLSSSVQELENIRKMKEELYISEQELKELSKRNNFLNRLNDEKNSQLLAEAKTEADYERAMLKIDEQKELTEQERHNFALTLAAEREIKEAETQKQVDAAMQKMRKAGLLREEEIENLKHEIAQKQNLRDLKDGHIIELATLQNQVALDKEKLEWEIQVGNKRIENDVARRRIVDSYEDERRKADADFEAEQRRRDLEIEKEESQNQMDMLRQAMQIRQERENAQHQNEMEARRLELESQNEKTRIYAGMTAEQIMAANPDISEHAAAALAEKFKSEAANNASEDKLKMALQQKDEMRSFMENMMQQQMSMQQNMMNNMRDVAVGSQQKQAELIKAKDDELNRTVQSSKENQDRYVDAMKTTVNAMANIHKAPPVTNVNARINPNAGVNTGISAQKSAAGVKVCPGCGANNPEDATFCEECGSSL